MRNLLIIIFFLFSVVSVSPGGPYVSPSDTVLKTDSMNFAVLQIDFLTYAFEAVSVCHYEKCPNDCDIDSLPLYMYWDPSWDYAWVYFYYKYDTSLLFKASIHWMGTGQIYYPNNFIHGSNLTYGNDVIPLPADAQYFNTTIAGNYCTWDEYKDRAHRAWEAIDSLNLTIEFAKKPFYVGLYAYSRTEGLFNPVNADWIIFMYQGNEFPATIQLLKEAEIISVYPNPVKDDLVIEFMQELPDLSVEVFDEAGLLISFGTLRPDDKMLVVHTQAWSPGVYLIRVMSGGRFVASRKIIR
jgi:hypothetical protein